MKITECRPLIVCASSCGCLALLSLIATIYIVLADKLIFRPIIFFIVSIILVISFLALIYLSCYKISEMAGLVVASSPVVSYVCTGVIMVIIIISFNIFSAFYKKKDAKIQTINN